MTDVVLAGTLPLVTFDLAHAADPLSARTESIVIALINAFASALSENEDPAIAITAAAEFAARVAAAPVLGARAIGGTVSRAQRKEMAREVAGLIERYALERMNGQTPGTPSKDN